MEKQLIYPLHRYVITGRTTSHFKIYKNKRGENKPKEHKYTQVERYKKIKNKIISTLEELRQHLLPTHFFSLFYHPKMARIHAKNFDINLLTKYNKAFFRGIQKFYPNSWFLRTFDESVN